MCMLYIFMSYSNYIVTPINYILITREPKGPMVAHLIKWSTVTVEPFTEDH